MAETGDHERVSNKGQGVTYYSVRSEGAGVLQHLRNVHVQEGDRIKLEVFFRVPIVDAVWLKGNEEIKINKNVKHWKSRKIMHLLLFKSVMDDTGIYYAVAKTEDGQVHSSFADVLVTPVNKSATTIDHQDLNRLPSIIEFPCEIDLYEKEKIRFVCRVQHDLNTSIEWYKDGVCITHNKDFVTVDYGGECIGLTKNEASVADAGKYTLTLLNNLNGRKDSAVCDVSITPMKLREGVPAVTVIRPLMSAVACVGTRVVFDCSFDLSDPTYFYVVWYVGTYKVERTNSRFSVVYKGGEYLLYIPKLEPEMAGSVVCELRKGFHDLKSLKVSSTLAHLSIVPSKIVEDERKNNLHLQHTTLYEGGETSANELSNEGPLLQKMEESTTSGNGVFVDVNYLDISYSRLDDDWLFFLHASKGSRDANVSCHEIPKTNSTMIQWDAALFPNKCWYSIAIGQSDNSYLEAGVSSSPVIWTQRPPVETIMKIRVKSVPMPNNDHLVESAVSILPPEADVQKPLRSNTVGTMDDFLARYEETGELLGCGAFGSVVLARDRAGNRCAVKFIKTDTKRSRRKAIQEHEIMLKLHHPKLIQMFEGFISENSFVIVMEHLWGGELFMRIVQEEYMREPDVLIYVKQICKGLSYLHTQKIVHMDIKPENIVCVSPNSCQVKIIDFGLATHLNERSKRAIYGTTEYMAPEVLNYMTLTVACDMWSTGVLSYMIVSGNLPFERGDANNREITARITAADYNYNDIAFDEISDLAKDFIDKLLVLEPRARMTADQALEHEWLQEGSYKAAKGCMRRTRENMKTYLAEYRAKWHRAGQLVIAANRLRTHAVSTTATEGHRGTPKSPSSQ